MTSDKTINFDGIRIENLCLQHASIPGSTFRGCEIVNTDFSHAILDDCRFDRTEIDNVIFSGCSLNHASFISACLWNVDFSSSNLAKSTFQNASMGKGDGIQTQDGFIDLRGVIKAPSCVRNFSAYSNKIIIDNENEELWRHLHSEIYSSNVHAIQIVKILVMNTLCSILTQNSHK